MSEKPTETADAPKKKSKLPIMIALVAIVGGGGFFAMKGKGGPKPVEKIKAGEIEKLDEVLVNLKDGSTYLRAVVALQVKEGFKAEDFKKYQLALSDRVSAVLASQSVTDLRADPEHRAIKKRIAEEANKVLDTGEDKKDEPEAKDKDAKPNKDEAVVKETKKTVEAPPDWDSATGPVIRVYFVNFAWQ